MAENGTARARARLHEVCEPLDAAGAPYDVVEHEPTFSALEEAAAARHPPAAVAKTIVLHDRAALHLAVLPASERLDLGRTREALGATRHLRLATEEEIAADFPGFDVGATPPVGGATTAAVVDRRLLEADRILFAAGDHALSVRLDPRDLVRVAGALVADVSEG